MTRKLLFVAFLLTLALTFVAANHQLTNAAPDISPPPQHAPSIASASTAVSPTWQLVAGGGGKDDYLSGVSMASPTDGWAVGHTTPSSYGTLTHYDGTTWTLTTVSTSTNSIQAIKMISQTEGWAVGYNACGGPCDNGLLMHYTQAGWQKVALPPHPGGGYWSGGFYGIDIKGNAGWIVGDYNYFLQFTGSSWTPITAPLGSNAVSVVDANEAWAVGSNSPMTTSNIAHWISGTWSLVTPTYNSFPPNYKPYLQGVDVSAAGEGWAVGYARYNSSNPYQCLIMHYTSGTWTQATCPPGNDNILTSVAMRSPNDVWAVGYQGRTFAARTGIIYHYNGSTWVTATLPSGTLALSSVKLVGADDGWITGYGGTILRLVNDTWTRVNGSNLYVGPISAVSANEVWYGGQTGQLYRWQNGTVTQYTSPLTTSISALDMITPTLGWGYTTIRPYNLFRYSSGIWTVWSTRTLAIDMIGPNEGWIGQNYGVMHYISGTFNYQSGPNSYGAKSLSMLDSNHGWAISSGKFSTVFEPGVIAVVTYTNGIWAAVTPTMTYLGYQVVNILGISPGEAWVAGYTSTCTPTECPASPELDHFVGGAWTNFPLPDWRALLGISKVSSTEWWATGKLITGTYAFLHYKDGVFTTVPAASEDVGGVSMLPDGSGFASGVGSLLRLQSYPYKVYLPIVLR